MTAVETDFFDGKCDIFVEGYCYDTRNGCVQIYPVKSFDELDNEQRKYEKQLIQQQEKEIAELDTIVLNLQYNSLVEEDNGRL